MKAIIPVAGAGLRLRPHTYTQPKVLLPVAGKPILGVIIDQLIEGGFLDFIFIIGYLGDKIRDYVNKEYSNINATFIQQVDRHGLGHAIWTANKALDSEEEVFIVLGDTIVDIDIKKLLSSEHSTLGVMKVEDPRGFGVAEIDENNFIVNLTEKPNIPLSNMALVGIYRIKETGKLFEALDHTIEHEIKTNGEFQLTDALMWMLKQGVKFKALKVENWYDLGQREVLLETNAILLKKFGGSAETTFKFHNTIINPPVSVAENAEIANSIIGPNVTIGENSKINYSIIRESIIANYTTLENVVLDNSIIGSDASITGFSQSLNIGDNTEIDLRGAG